MYVLIIPMHTCGYHIDYRRSTVYLISYNIHLIFFCINGSKYGIYCVDFQLEIYRRVDVGLIEGRGMMAH